MNKTRIHIRHVGGVFGGWTVSCPVCPSVAVRDSWPQAMAHTHKHISIHQRGPFMVEKDSPR